MNWFFLPNRAFPAIRFSFWLAGGWLLTIALASCHAAAEKPTPAAAEAPSPQKTASKDQLTVSAAQFAAAGIETGGFVHKNMASSIQANGVIDVPPQKQVSISAVLGGYVQALNVLPGQFVRQGQVLAVLQHPDYLKLQQQYLEGWARLTFLQQELQRQQTLDAEDVGARRRLQQAQAEFATEQATERSLAGQLRLLGLAPEQLQANGLTPRISLRAPIAGFIKAVNVNLGQYVTPQDVLAELVDRSDLHLELEVFEKDIAQVQEGQQVLFKVPASDATKEYRAQVFLVGKAFSKNARTVSVHAHLRSEAGTLLPGQYVAASIQTAGRQQPTLPEEAVIQGGGMSYIFARQPTETGYRFQRYKVRAGLPQNGDVAITPLEALPDTTQLVRRGAYFLEAELSKGQAD